MRALRPDIDIAFSAKFQELELGSHPECCARRGLYEKVRSLDCVLTTTYKPRLNLQLFKSGEIPRGISVFVVNPNFYHPFLQFDPEEAGSHTEKLKQAQAFLPLAEDRDIYELFLSAIRLQTDLSILYLKLIQLHSRMGRQYFDFVNRSAITTVIEGGVADGWVAAQFLGCFENSTVYGFDPDLELFERSYHKAFLMHSKRFHFMPLGLWHKSQRLSFEINKAFTSRVADGGCDPVCKQIEAVCIDDFVANENIDKVDFIKLDIEGAEPNAIRGAEKTIRSHRPQLAVCIYHRLEHYYEIPLLLSEYIEDYIFRVGHYSPFHVFSETVLYAIPRELYPSGSYS